MGLGRKRLYIGLFVVLVLPLLLPERGRAQTDSVPELPFAGFQKNIQALSGLYCFSDPAFYPGKFRLNTPQNVVAGFEKMNLGLFPVITQQTIDFYEGLNQLPETDKKNFVRLFSFYEKNFEAELKKARLPEGLKYLAPALSAMNPLAVGPDGKAGVWQLTHFQAVLNGGEINRLVDQRFNLLQSTRLAAKQLQQNFDIFQSPELAVAAYLCGNTKVKNAVSLAGSNSDVKTILTFLPDEFQKTVAAFQAVAVFLFNNRFEPAVNLLSVKTEPDTALVTRQLHFLQIEKVLGIPAQQLRFFNPQYKYSIVPENDKGKPLVLPHGTWDDFVLWNDSIVLAGDSSLFRVLEQKTEYPPEPSRRYVGEPVKNLEIEGKTKIQYRLKTGDVLGVIAERFDVSVTDLKYWNNIYDERRIQAGQKLDIFVSEMDAGYYSSLANTTDKKDTADKPAAIVEQLQKTPESMLELFDTSRKIEHVVQSGESPFIIAKKYEGVTPELILEWNNIDDPRKIQIGQKLIVYLKK